MKNWANWIIKILGSIFNTSNSPLPIKKIEVVEPEIITTDRKLNIKIDGSSMKNKNTEPKLIIPSKTPPSTIAIVVGHHQFAKGAFSKFFDSYEWDFNKRVVEMLRSNVDVYFHNPNILGYTARQKAMAKKLNQKKYNLVMELHFNAADPVANGVECFYYFKNKEGKEYAQLFNQIIVEEHGLKNRGAKALLSAKDRGYGFVYYPKAIAILLEPGFGTNTGDCVKLKSDAHLAMSIDRFVAAVEAHEIAESFGMP